MPEKQVLWQVRKTTLAVVRQIAMQVGCHSQGVAPELSQKPNLRSQQHRYHESFTCITIKQGHLMMNLYMEVT